MLTWGKLDAIRNDMETYDDELDHPDDMGSCPNQMQPQNKNYHSTYIIIAFSLAIALLM